MRGEPTKPTRNPRETHDLWSEPTKPTTFGKSPWKIHKGDWCTKNRNKTKKSEKSFGKVVGFVGF